MTTYSQDYSPLIDSSVHVDVTAVKHDSERTTFVYFAFVNNGTEVKPLFGTDHNVISVPNYRANDRTYVLSVALDAITIREGDTDSDWFDHYTENELAWSKSWLCEALRGEY